MESSLDRGVTEQFLSCGDRWWRPSEWPHLGLTRTRNSGNQCEPTNSVVAARECVGRWRSPAETLRIRWSRQLESSGERFLQPFNKP
jgi:hypothetical protein